MLASLLLGLLPGPITPGAVQDPPRVEARPDAAHSASWTPIELWRERWVFLRVRVNGVLTDAVLDSGAGISVMSEAEARRRGIRGGKRVATEGVGGAQRARLVGGIFVELGVVRLSNLTVAVIDLEEVEEHLGRRVPFVLGHEVFRGAVVDLDYPGRRVAFRDPEGYVYAGPGDLEPLHEIEGGKWGIDLEVEGCGPGRFQVDTGSGETVTLYGGFVRDHALLADRAPTSVHLTGGVGGTIEVESATLRTLTLGGTTLERVPASFADVDRGVFATDELAGNLGAGILARFRLIFDPRGPGLILEPAADARSAAFERDRSGLQTVWSEVGLRVIHVAPGSPAEAARWEVGAIIEAVDGQPVGEDYWEALAGWRFGEAGSRVVLRDGEGRERALVLADYF